jgi:hypothetical protein
MMLKEIFIGWCCLVLYTCLCKMRAVLDKFNDKRFYLYHHIPTLQKTNHHSLIC